MPVEFAAVKVFVSSTWVDLRPERRAVETALHRLRGAKFIGMEYSGSREDAPREFSLREVGRCHLYVAVIGRRYGSGITEDEYRTARGLNLPCLIYFKAGDPAPPGQREEGEEEEKRLAAFKAELRCNHVVSEFSNPDDLAARLTADMHHWLTDTYVTRVVEKAVGGEFTPARLEELLSAVRELNALGEGTRRAAVPAAPPHAPAVIHSGDIVFRIFTNAAPRLSQHIRVREFESLIRERTKEFVGREFVEEAIDGHLSDPQFTSGYIVIQGEPGIGKTALAGQLVKTRGYVHHFNIASQNIRSTGDFLRNVCAQLIARYRLDYAALPQAAGFDSGFLSRILSEIAARDGRPRVVIVIDALDEAEDALLPPAANRLLLPPALPGGIFFLVTTRERHEHRLVVDSRRDIYLRDDDPRNVEDVRRYLRAYMAEHEGTMRARVAEWGVAPEEFVETLTAKSQGNFMYLVYVLTDILRGRLTAGKVGRIDDLPQGLVEYYRRHWRTMQAQDPARFRDYYQPVICILAAVREPVAVEQLIEWTKRRWPHLDASEVRAIIRHWREFLNEERGSDGAARYRIYHTSFQDFLKEEVGLVSYHEVIARTVLSKLPGLGSG